MARNGGGGGWSTLLSLFAAVFSGACAVLCIVSLLVCWWQSSELVFAPLKATQRGELVGGFRVNESRVEVSPTGVVRVNVQENGAVLRLYDSWSHLPRVPPFGKCRKG